MNAFYLRRLGQRKTASVDSRFIKRLLFRSRQALPTWTAAKVRRFPPDRDWRARDQHYFINNVAKTYRRMLRDCRKRPGVAYGTRICARWR